MGYKTYVADLQGVEDILNGSILLGPFSSRGLPVGAKTLVFTTPAATVTFSGAAGAYLTPDQIVTEINAVVAGLAKRRNLPPVGPRYSNQPDSKRMGEQPLALQRDAGITLGNAGTGNALLGLGGAPVISAGKVLAAKIVGFSQGSMQAHYALVIEL